MRCLTQASCAQVNDDEEGRYTSELGKMLNIVVNFLELRSKTTTTFTANLIYRGNSLPAVLDMI
jgi:hypothetical protein